MYKGILYKRDEAPPKEKIVLNVLNNENVFVFMLEACRFKVRRKMIDLCAGDHDEDLGEECCLFTTENFHVTTACIGQKVQHKF